MSDILDSARQFFEACETGQGWDACKEYCTENATFSAQASALAGIDSLAGYCEWTKNILTPVPDGHYELKFFAADADEKSVTAVSVFHGIQSGPGGPVPPTNKTVATDYVYHMQMEGGRIKHMTKIWNDAHCLQQLGWS